MEFNFSYVLVGWVNMGRGAVREGLEKWAGHSFVKLIFHGAVVPDGNAISEYRNKAFSIQIS